MKQKKIAIFLFILVIKTTMLSAQVNAVNNGTFTVLGLPSLSGWTQSNTGWFAAGGGAAGNYDNGSSSVPQQSLYQVVTDIVVTGGKVQLKFDYTSGNCNGCYPASNAFTFFDIYFGGTRYLQFYAPSGTANVSVTTYGGATLSPSGSFPQETWTSFTLSIPWSGAAPASGELRFVHRPRNGSTNGYDDNFIRNIFMEKLVVLPVTIGSFSANNSAGKTTLLWKTDAEQSTSHFEIEQSSDGINFEKIGDVSSSNNAAGSTYSFQTSQPAQMKRYRLKIVDIDGKYEYSKLLYVAGSSSAANRKSIVFPNPITETNFTLTIGNEALRNTVAFLYAIDGRFIKTYQITQDSQQFNTTGLRPGLYVLKLNNGEMIQLIKK